MCQSRTASVRFSSESSFVIAPNAVIVDLVLAAGASAQRIEEER